MSRPLLFLSFFSLLFFFDFALPFLFGLFLFCFVFTRDFI
jgi:hypothetical protein